MFADYNGIEVFFLVCAVIGGFFVVVKMILQFIGGDAEAEFVTDLDIDAGGGHTDSDVGFKILSLHSLSAFLMMFGLVGLALYRQNRAGFATALVGGSLAGLAAVWLIGKLFQGASRLQSSGTLQTSAALGCTGTVYLTIPEQGTGRVSISFQSRLREFDAVAIDGKKIPTGTAIKVVQVNANVLVVDVLS
jgi:membrane protein implicated in regulation of membrane protease activity